MDPGAFEKLTERDELKRHREHTQTLPRTSPRPPLKGFVYTSRYYLLFLYSVTSAPTPKRGREKKKKKNPENRRAAVSPVVRLRSRVRFLRRNICRIYFLGFPLSPVTEGSGDTSVRVCRWSNALPSQSGTMKTLRAGRKIQGQHRNKLLQ